MSKKIFISYRRADAQMAAGRLFDALVRRFGSRSVFRDKEGIRPGYDWAEEIQRVLHEDVVVLALIGPSWIGALDAHGQRRLEDQNDPNRIELETALGKSLPVIPVLIEGAAVPDASEMPHSLVPLTRRHAIRLRDDDWGADFSRIAAAVEALGVSSGDSSVSSSSPETGRLGWRIRWAAGGVLAIALGGLTWWTIVGRESASDHPLAISAPGSAVPVAPFDGSTLRPSGRPDSVDPNGTPQRAQTTVPGSGRSSSVPSLIPTPAVGRPSSQSAFDRVQGDWHVVQYNTNGTTHQGTLSLSTDARGRYGYLAWDGLARAEVTDARVTNEHLEFTAKYPDGVEGTYTASITDSGQTLTDGETVGGGATATWSGSKRTARPTR